MGDAEFRKMPAGRELDEHVAIYALGMRTKWTPWLGGTAARLWCKRDDSPWHLCPDYSTDEWAAHTVIEKVGGWWSLERSEDGQWIVQRPHCMVTAKYAAEAIAKAAVLEARANPDARATR